MVGTASLQSISDETRDDEDMQMLLEAMQMLLDVVVVVAVVLKDWYLCYDHVRFMDNDKYGEVVLEWPTFLCIYGFHVFDKSSHSETRGLSIFSITANVGFFFCLLLPPPPPEVLW
ncbi:MAG: hypothetical protein GY696_10830 [Gammaproteobacteria bacterium]|nr:hypothetical protein [Gammaproteobacteria bacterium]